MWDFCEGFVFRGGSQIIRHNYKIQLNMIEQITSSPRSNDGQLYSFSEQVSVAIEFVATKA